LKPDKETSPAELAEHYVGVILRGRWWVLLSTCVLAVGAVVALHFVPNRYTSEATVLVVEQQVPERYVTPTTTTDIIDALDAMTQKVLSRTLLLGVIEELDLYREERRHQAPEQVVAVMRRHVQIAPILGKQETRSVNAFKITFSATDPQQAQQVASRLTSLFIQENLKSREDQANVTTNFLRQQLEVAKQKLTDQEQRLRDFKMQYLGELPEQQQGNVGILMSLQTQLQNVVSSISRAQQQRLYLQSLLSEYKRASRRPATVVAPGVPERRIATPLEAVQLEMARLRAARAVLLDTYTPNHPDVVALDRQIARQETVLARLRAEAPPPDAGETARKEQPASVQEREHISEEDAGNLAQLRSQLEANRVEIENLVKEEQQLKTKSAEYQARLNMTPVREQQLTSLVRDYDMLKHNYSDLLSKELQSQLSTNLEKQQEGQQFRLVDPPSLPIVPSSPKRLRISLGAVAAGFCLGVALAVLMDLRKGAFHIDTEVARTLAVPLVLNVPVLVTPEEGRRRAWRRTLECVGASAVLVLIAAAEFYVYKQG
jgi:polysaccharide chain length determinant protein (PEP-CTERM system associated)